MINYSGFSVSLSGITDQLMKGELMEANFISILTKTVAAHTVTYLIVGTLAYRIFNYTRLFAETELRLIMRPTTDPLVRMGVIFQPLRGIIFGITFYILRNSLFTVSNGWLLIWVVLVALGILSTFGATASSIEGIIFTKYPLRIHLIGFPELLLQSFLLSFLVYYWVNNPGAQWLNRMMWSLFAIAIFTPIISFLKDRKSGDDGDE